jgi:hypothetical protein
MKYIINELTSADCSISEFFLVESMTKCCMVSVTADIDSTATFPCCHRVRNNSLFRLMLRGSVNQSIQLLYTDSVINLSHASRLTAGFDQATLLQTFRLKDIKLSDAGLYFCYELHKDKNGADSEITESQITHFSVTSMSRFAQRYFIKFH